MRGLRRHSGRWHDFLARCAASGDVVRLPAWPRRCVLLSNPADIEAVLLTDRANFVKPPAILRNRSVFGEGLMVSEGKPWLRQRRQAQPAFARPRIAEYGAAVVEETERMLKEWRDGERRDVHADMKALALAVNVRLLLGADARGADRQLGRAVAGAMDAFAERSPVHHLLPEVVPLPSNLRLRRAVRRLETMLEERGQAEDGMLSRIVAAAEDGGGPPLSAREKRDLLFTLFQAGQHTTAAALAWTWHLLGGHPEARAKLEEEAAAVLGGRAAAGADVERLGFAGSVALESLRLFPPVWSFARRAVEERRLGGFRIPAGTIVVMSQWVVHRDPRNFPDPEAFRPSRWSDGLLERLPRFAYFPFGGGPRLCIGDSLAMSEIVLVLATAARRFRLKPVPGHEVRPEPGFNLRPRGGLPMIVQRR